MVIPLRAQYQLNPLEMLRMKTATGQRMIRHLTRQHRQIRRPKQLEGRERNVMLGQLQKQTTSNVMQMFSQKWIVTIHPKVPKLSASRLYMAIPLLLHKLTYLRVQIRLAP